MASKLVMVAIIVLDIIAFGLAVAAEQRRSTVSLSSFLNHLCFVRKIPI